MRKIVCGYRDEKDEKKVHWKPLDEIHKQITDVVSLIRQRVAELGDNFKPWDDVSTLTVEYHRNKGYLKVEDNECLNTIDDVAAVFGTRPKHKGYLRASGVAVPGKKNEIVWWPTQTHRSWRNILSEDKQYIREYPVDDKDLRKQAEAQKTHLKQWLAAPEETRITFLKYKDDLGFCFYRFVGVFRLNKDKSIQEDKCVWERVSDTYKLNAQ